MSDVMFPADNSIVHRYTVFLYKDVIKPGALYHGPCRGGSLSYAKFTTFHDSISPLQ